MWRFLPSTPDPEELKELARASREVLLVSALVGAIAGLAAVVFEVAVFEMLGLFRDLPLWTVAIGPPLGMLAAHFILRTVGGGATPSTSDEYLKRFHQEGGVLGGKPFRGRVLASAVALGTGNMLGLEGPAIYLGASAGATVQRRLPRLFGRIDHRLLLVAGAAGGVAAVFRAPATGAIFAIESPYQGDLAHSSLLPALIGASTGYVTFSLLLGNEPLFPVEGATDVMVPQLGIALLVGAVAGLVARWGASALALAKRLSTRGPDWRRLLLAGTVISATSVAVRLAADTPGVLGPGYGLVNWALEDNRAIWALVIILIARNLGTAASVAGGVPGGLFVPLVVAGALLGRLCGELIGTESTTLYPVIGIAAVLGAGYRVPLAAIMFVAETTGRPGFVVPGLLAAVAAELMMGSHSFTAYQKKAQLVSGNRRSRGAGRGSDPLTGEIRTVGPDADGAPPVSTGRPVVTGEQPPVAEVVRPPVGEPTRPKLVDQRNDTSEIQQLATGGGRQVTGEVRHLTGEMKPITGQGQSEGPPPVGDAKLPEREPPLPPAAPPPALPGEVLLPSTRQWLAPDPDADAEVEAAEAEVEAAADANAHADRDAGSATETGVRDPFPKDFDAE
ncbi:MAG: chloride channel protein [Candidatus Microthrix sp.]|nr:chloride channel protein [Candidatus Microthrix sp.]